jgi:predicted lipoprotein with Yx(FWY)xxD motif
MNRLSRDPLPTAAGLLGLALVMAACQTGGAGSPTAAASAGADGGVLVTIADSSQVGEHLVDAEGRSLYVFLNDSPGMSACEGGCLDAWPPASVVEGTSLTAGDGVSAELGTLERADGTLQLTLDGWPLYRYAADADPGEVTGEGVGEVWFVARPDGSVPSLDDAGTQSPEASATGSGGDDPYDY